MMPRLRRWIALLALLLASVIDAAAAPLCMSAETEPPAASEASAHHRGHGDGADHHGHRDSRGEDGERRGEGDGPASPACPLGMTVGAGGCLGGYLAPATMRVVADAPDRHAFLPPAHPRPRLAAVSLFRPPRA